MGISLQGIGAVGKEQLISSCSNGEPNWSYIPTKGKFQKRRWNLLVKLKNWHDDQLRQQIRQNRIYFQTGS